jgi:hypothetical protein
MERKFPDFTGILVSVSPNSGRLERDRLVLDRNTDLPKRSQGHHSYNRVMVGCESFNAWRISVPRPAHLLRRGGRKTRREFTRVAHFVDPRGNGLSTI